MGNSGSVASIRYSIVIPIYGAADVVVELVERIVFELDKQGEPYEIIMVEDDGPDNSWEVMKSLLPRFPQLRLFKLTRNFGQHNALMCGFAKSRGDLIITLDDDLQNPPEEISKLILKIEEGYDVVYGVPTKKNHHPLRNIGSYLVRLMYEVIFKTSVFITAFRVIRKDIISGILTYNKNFTFIDGLIAWHTTNIGEVEVEHHRRGIGVSGYSVRKLVTLAMNMFTNFSILPLQLVSFIGLIFASIGFILSLGYLIKYLFWGVPVPGYTSIMIGITMFSGVQMLSLGLIGEYLGRIHLNINSKPQYFIRESFADNDFAEGQ